MEFQKIATQDSDSTSSETFLFERSSLSNLLVKKSKLISLITKELSSKKYLTENQYVLAKESIIHTFGKELIDVVAKIRYLKSLSLGHPENRLLDLPPTDKILDALKIPIQSLLTEAVALEESEANKIFFHCPFHRDKTPTCSINKVTNTFYCFGCQRRGDSIAFVQLLNHCSFIEAINTLNQ